MNAHTRIAVIGDVGGHFGPLAHLLGELGVRFGSAIEWPQDLHVVQVGDLVHRGPASAEVVGLVADFLERGVWTQIVGNHEQLYVDRPIFGWNETIDEAAQTQLRDWWADGRLRPAAAVIDGSGEEWLITHAGLTTGFWRHGLGAPDSAEATVAALKEAADDGALWHPGTMLLGVDDDNAGPVWAAAGTEVYPSWPRLGTEMPFNQVHGHSSAFDWNRSRWSAESRIQQQIRLDVDHRHATFEHAGRRIVGIDPCHLAEAAPVFDPFILHGATIS
ncbi:MAG: metallophosphoesterase [Brevibacterium sp.]|uniref:metallophosphoesterase n=1 Tax=Brevibacterium sp. TaxID=1701 RepID=UPI003F8EF3F9